MNCQGTYVECCLCQTFSDIYTLTVRKGNIPYYVMSFQIHISDNRLTLGCASHVHFTSIYCNGEYIQLQTFSNHKLIINREQSSSLYV